MEPETTAVHGGIPQLRIFHSFFDQVQLLAVDHLSNGSVVASPYGEILTYMNPCLPKSAIDDDHKQVEHLISAFDEEYYEGFNGSYITLNFGDELDVSQGAKLVLRADLIPPKPVPRSIYIQVQDCKHNWKTVATVIPRRYWATEIIDLSNYLPNAKGDLKVRLYCTANHKIDFIGLDTSPQATINIPRAELISAKHSKDGDSTVFNGLFESDVKSKLLYDDGNHAEIIHMNKLNLLSPSPKYPRMSW